MMNTEYASMNTEVMTSCINLHLHLHLSSADVLFFPTNVLSSLLVVEGQDDLPH